ncbi:hypothetical protein [Corallococcus exercitus]|uniref:hypothetical protein n=1 Tax=Corallococcus exercitus TaxID=2316736 RepID=UPI0035D4DFD8
MAQFLGDGYNVSKALRQGKSWEQMNPEQQAEFIELAFGQGCFETPPAPFELDGKDSTEQFEAAKKSLRAGQ